MAAFLNRGNLKFNTNIFAACDNNPTTVTLSVNAVPPNIPCILTIDPGLSTEERVGVTGSGTNTITVVRNYDGAGIYSHSVNAQVVDYVNPGVISDIIAILESNFNSNGTPKGMLTPDFSKTFANFVVSGLNPSVPGSSLTQTIPSGTVFWNGVETTIAADGGHTYTASQDTYVDVNPTSNVYTYNGVANNAAAPALTGNTIRIAKIITNGTVITTITQTGLDSNNIPIYPTFAGIGLGVPTGTPSAGQVLTALSSTIAAWQTLQTQTDGWITATDTLVYVSANSFKITGVNRTSIYAEGTRIKFTNNSATFYGVVASSSFSTDTTVTLFANNDYSINNSAITSPYYSYQASPQGYPNWFNYTPTISWNSTAPSTPTLVAKFSVIGNTCFVSITQSNTTAGSTNTSINVSTPITPIGTASQHNYALAGMVSSAAPTSTPSTSAIVSQYDTTSPIFQLNFSSISGKTLWLSGFFLF